MDANLPFQSLQCHTVNSDGELTHNQVLDECLKHKIGVVAYTDHDNLMDSNVFNELKVKNHPVKFISGTELTVDKIDGFPECTADSLHIVGLFVDPTNPDLVDYCRLKKERRVERIKNKVVGLKKFGFNIEFSDVEKLVPNGLFTSTQVSNAVIAKEENIRLLKKTLDKYRKLAETDRKIKEKFDLIDPENYYKMVFSLYMGRDALVPGMSEEKNEFVLTLTDGVSLIRNAGGLAIFAHWSDYRGQLSRKVLDILASQKRVDGLEIVYGYAKNDMEWPEYQDGIVFAKSLCDKYHLIKAGGGDFHRRVDFDVMELPRSVNLNKDTIGMTQTILDLRQDIKTTWSTL